MRFFAQLDQPNKYLHMKKILVVLLLPLLAQATELIVPYAPGGAADSFGRAAALYYEKNQKQTITVINKPGGGGTIGTRYALSQKNLKPTLVVANSGSFLFNKIFYKNPSYDYSDFDIVGPYVQTPSVLAVSDTHITTIGDFISASYKKKTFTCGTSSAAGAVVGRYILQHLKIDSVEIIMYKGSAEVSAALLGKHIDCAFDTYSSLMPLYKNKNITIIATGGDNNKEIPNATLYQNIVPNLVFYYWYGIAIPHRDNQTTSKEILNKFSAMYRDKNFQTSMNLLGFEVIAGEKNTNSWLDQQYQKFDHMRESAGIGKE